MVQLPGFDLIGRRCHGGAVPGMSSLHETGKGKGSFGGQYGKGMMALPDAPAMSAAAGVVPLWREKGWVEPGSVEPGRIITYRNELERPNGPAGWIALWDQGPDVYFTPDALDGPLQGLLSRGELRYTRVNCKVYYRRNGHHRHSREVYYLEEETRADGA